MELIMENIRCFAGEHRIPVKPLTFLVGENSTGKTTFLAMLSTVLNSDILLSTPRFNQPPYNLGNFNTVATSKGDDTGYLPSIKIGYRHSGGEAVATYMGNSGQTVISKLALNTTDVRLDLTFDTLSTEATFSIRVTNNIEGTVQQFKGLNRNKWGSDLVNTDFMIYTQAINEQSHNPESLNAISQAVRMFMPYRVFFPSKSIAPIRIKPQRTYDEVTREFSPEGNDVPFVLQDVLNDPQKRGILERFGNESGLFSSLDLKMLQGGLGEPRQIAVTNVGQTTPVNLVDVGYGVSQVLPVLIQSILTSPETMLLLQQPEVHLHPRAQAALGTLFVDLVQQNKNQFVVETHSDYILDRVRQEVAKGKIPAEDVSILYFERQGYEAKVYPIDLDENGNILNAPPTYRDFFLREEMNLLSR